MRSSCGRHQLPSDQHGRCHYHDGRRNRIHPSGRAHPSGISQKHIPGAINIPNETIGTEEIPELTNKDKLILLYCRSGNRSKRSSEKLAVLGNTNIVEFGSINDWSGEIVTE